MYILTLELTDDTAKVYQVNKLFIEDKAYAEKLISQISEASAEFDDTSTPEGRIVTPLPPGKTYSAEGIITPKAPLQVAVEQKRRVSNIPDELMDDYSERPT